MKTLKAFNAPTPLFGDTFPKLPRLALNLLLFCFSSYAEVTGMHQCTFFSVGCGIEIEPSSSHLNPDDWKFPLCGPGNSSFAKVHNHQDLRMTFKTHLKRPSTIVCTCIPNFEEVSTSRRTSGLCLASSLKDSVSKTCKWHLRNTTHARVPAQMCTYHMYTWKIRLVKQPGRLLSLKCK